MHNKHTLDGLNMDLQGQWKSKEDYLRLAEMYQWEDPLQTPKIDTISCPSTTGMNRQFFIVREDLVPGGTKTRLGDLLISVVQEDTIVYVQPRTGFAAIALTELCKRYKKRLVLFCPACKEISQHQAITHNAGAELKFARVAAMPNLNNIARKWAYDNGAFFVPLGMKHPLVTAAGVKVAHDMICHYGVPNRVWTAISTGVLTRALQIAWPRTWFGAVAVARNIHEGESGCAEVYSSEYEFVQPTRRPPPFPSVGTYDAKVWEYMEAYGQNGDLFWNVAADLPTVQIPDVDSRREWGEVRY